MRQNQRMNLRPKTGLTAIFPIRAEIIRPLIFQIAEL